MHYALYAFMIATSILGWLTPSAGEGDSIVWVGGSGAGGSGQGLGGSGQGAAETLVTVGYFVAGLHAAAALLHYYVLRDNTLVRMLPGRR